MEEEIKFSIICPVFNADKFLVDCINSVINQTYKNWELILVDDGSTDLSSSLCDEFSAKYAQIKVYHLKNCGPYNARIFGYKNASGNFILSMDSDDTYAHDALQTINKLIIENNFDLLFYNCFLEENGKKIVLDDFKYNNGLTSDHTQIVKTYFHNFILNQGLYRKCFSKALLNKIDLSNRSERIFEDGLFSLKLFNASKHLLVRNDLCLYSYRKINIESLTMKYSVDNIKIQFNNLLEHFVIVDNDVLLEHETKVDLYTDRKSTRLNSSH